MHLILLMTSLQILTLFNYLITLKPCSVDEQVVSIILVLILVDQLFLVRLEVVVD